MKRYCPITILSLLFVLLHLGIGCSYHSKKKKKHKPIPTVRVQSVKQEVIQDTLSLTGSIEPVRMARLASPAEGPIKNLLVREGDHVNKGKLLLKIGRTTALDAQSASAKENLRLEQDELKRIKRLVTRGAIAGDELDRAVARVKKAESEMAKTKEYLKDYQVIAPWKGIIGRVLVTEGEFVAPRQVMVEMFDPNSLVLRFALPEKNAMHVQKNQQIKVSFDALPNNVFWPRW